MRNHAETHGVTNIRLPELGCGLDKLQPSIVNTILHEVFQKTKVGITVCIRNHSLIKVNSSADIEPKMIQKRKNLTKMNLNSSRQKTLEAQTLSQRTRNTPENMQNENSLHAMIKDRFLATYTSED